MLAATAVFAPVVLSGPVAHAAVPSAREHSKTWAKRHAIGLKAVVWARKEIGKWYRYGGAGPKTFDCSGLVQYVYRHAGVKLPRTADAQHRYIHLHVRRQNLEPGDLLYFYGDGHTGIVSKRVGNKIYMIHASHTGAPIRQVLVNSYYWSVFNGAARPY
jgi:cell wall-associated NlpC family hydrolase